MSLFENQAPLLLLWLEWIKHPIWWMSICSWWLDHSEVLELAGIREIIQMSGSQNWLFQSYQRNFKKIHVRAHSISNRVPRLETGDFPWWFEDQWSCFTSLHKGGLERLGLCIMSKFRVNWVKWLILGLVSNRTKARMQMSSIPV